MYKRLSMNTLSGCLINSNNMILFFPCSNGGNKLVTEMELAYFYV